MENQDKTNQIVFIDPDELIQFVEEGSHDFNEPSEAESKPNSEEEQVTSAPIQNEEVDDEDDDEYLSDEEFEKIFEKKYSDEMDKSNILKKRESTRGTLAIIYTLFTFLIFGVGILVATLDGINRDVSIIDNLKEILPLISGIFLGSLGFVLGYYFRRGDE